MLIISIRTTGFEHTLSSTWVRGICGRDLKEDNLELPAPMDIGAVGEG